MSARISSVGGEERVGEADPPGWAMMSCERLVVADEVVDARGDRAVGDADEEHPTPHPTTLPRCRRTARPTGPAEPRRRPVAGPARGATQAGAEVAVGGEGEAAATSSADRGDDREQQRPPALAGVRPDGSDPTRSARTTTTDPVARRRRCARSDERRAEHRRRETRRRAGRLGDLRGRPRRRRRTPAPTRGDRRAERDATRAPAGRWRPGPPRRSAPTSTSAPRRRRGRR